MFGIGRTSLVRHIAKITQDKWKFLFADFSRNPDQVCRELEKQLKSDIFYKRPNVEGYKSRRRQVVSLVSRDSTPHVFVLDNIDETDSAETQSDSLILSQRAPFC